ncbi:MAG TPA: radical SAM protein, partial [Spirochaetia bacterium]|nr:radical SAM protein [Spirochaetia bacterium]
MNPAGKPAIPECLVMAKPAGPGCNLRCAYCYYLRKASMFAGGPWRMPEDLLERYIVQRLEGSPGPVTHFEWHGGEPTLLGLDYFRLIVRIQKAHRPPGRAIMNGIQTNGALLDERWAGFLDEERFSVGLSMDGPADL